MIRGNKICGIMIPKKDGNGSKVKLPKLVEMYDILFHRKAEHLHNSMVDVLVTMRCYLKLKYHKDVDDYYFEELLDKAVKNKDINGAIVYESYGEAVPAL
jgi:DNA polymerase III epsilon subunit-like protein